MISLALLVSQVSQDDAPFLWGLTRIQFAWALFGAITLIAFAVDLFGFERKAHVISNREALGWSLVWVVLALAFCAFIWLFFDAERGKMFLAGYLLEKALSVDNLFVFLIVFEYFRVPREAESRVLHWGIIGALVMRAGFIFGGAALMNSFHWTSYLFAAVLLYTAIKMVAKKEEEVHPDRNPVVRLVRRILPVAPVFDGAKFFTIHEGKRMATVLFVVVVVIESTDVIFAIDSIPAILAVTTDQFLVYTSNVFAIMGLRMLYFLLANVMTMFHYLKYGLAFILAFVAVKLGFAHHKDILSIPIGVSLGVIAGTLFLCIIASLIFKPKPKEEKKGDSSSNGEPQAEPRSEEKDRDKVG